MPKMWKGNNDMIDKRAFMLGFMVGDLANRDVDTSVWFASINKWCKAYHMSPPDIAEIKEIVDFMEYAISIRRRDG